jgi:quinol-cytochrome oxidoreductase complex cytochrome b subunit
MEFLKAKIDWLFEPTRYFLGFVFVIFAALKWRKLFSRPIFMWAFFVLGSAFLVWAIQDIMALREHVPLGIMRELHRWAAHMMVITVWLHMYRVFLTGSYKPPREFNWNVGVILLVLTLLLSFTGYLLPWDQLAIWAITVGSNMARATPVLGHEGPGAQLLVLGDVKMVHAGSDARFALLGGRFVGEGALLRFYVLHCVGIPLVAGILMAVHFWRVRKDGGISGPL